MASPFRHRFLPREGCQTSQAAILCNSKAVQAYLTAGDSVRVEGEGDALPSFVGRIIEVRTSTADCCDDNKHPGARGNYNPLFLVQQFITTDDWDANDWPVVDRKTAAVGIREAAQTNMCIWVAPKNILEVVFFFHEEDVLEHTFGNAAGRENCFFVRYKVERTDEESVEFEPICRCCFESFGGHFSVTSGVEIFTERM